MYQNELKFGGVYSENNLPKLKGGIYAIKLHEYKSIGAHWIALYLNSNNVGYFDNFEVEHIQKKKFLNL